MTETEMDGPMREDRFAALAEAYGGDIARWPVPAQAGAAALAARSEQARTALEEARALDAALEALAPAPVAPPGADFLARAEAAALAEIPARAASSPHLARGPAPLRAAVARRGARPYGAGRGAPLRAMLAAAAFAGSAAAGFAVGWFGGDADGVLAMLSGPEQAASLDALDLFGAETAEAADFTF